MAEKLDLYKKLKAEYATPKSPRVIKTRPGTYWTVVGKGEPDGEVFQSRLGALYAMAYTIKFAYKAKGKDFVVCKLEGLWWLGDKGGDFATTPKSQWNWKLLIRCPSYVRESDLAAAISDLKKKEKSRDTDRIRLETIDEGDCVQVLHVGPYDAEAATIKRMREFTRDNGLRTNGLHHEIYLSDPRRVPPQRLRTILRQPVAPA